SVIDGHLSLFHKSLVEWLTDATAGSHRFLVDCADGERALLNYCARWATLDDDYPLHEFPAHLVRAHDLEGLEAILLNEQFATRRRRAGIHTSVDLEDFRVFASTLLEDNREVEVAALALTSNVQRRDGVAAALRDAGADSDAAARRIVRLLLKPTSHRSAGEPTPEELSGRLVAVRTAAARGYREELVDAARDSSPVVRGGLVPELYHFWSTRPEERWNLLADLGRHFSGRFGMPHEEMVEIIGGLATAIVAQEFDDAATMDRLGIYCRDLMASTVGSPVTKAISRRAVLKVGVRALDRLLRNQPDYQPVNLKEINRCYPLSADVRQRVSSIVTTLEEPDRGYGSVVDALMGGEQPYDILLMVAAERALIFHGSRDPGGVVSAVGRVYADGFSWFGQSCLYVLSKILETCPLPVAEDGWLESYAAITADFVKKTGATLVTPIATYEVSPPLAGIEVVFERHRPSGRARFLPGYLRLATGAGDVALARRIIKAAELLSLLGHPFTALDA
ncbi:MAG TPA: hypothetical protein VGR90_07920, partial [Acidimicrobiales bacterium]|nr:hypothetical protein [Acidimicrobiales bacterium]